MGKTYKDNQFRDKLKHRKFSKEEEYFDEDDELWEGGEELDYDYLDIEEDLDYIPPKNEKIKAEIRYVRNRTRN